MMEDMEKKLMFLLATSPCISLAGTYGTYARAARDLINNGVTVQRWIPVTERLPDVGVDVLVVKDNGDKSMAVWRLYRTIPNGQPYWEDEVGDGLALEAATQWMPLPEPPMRKGENG